MPETYEELFERLEHNVELLRSHDIGLGERLALCRESRILAHGCVSELDKADREIDELRLDDLLAGRARPVVLQPVGPTVRAPDPGLLLSTRLLIVGRALELSGQQVTLVNLAAGISPPALAQLGSRPDVAEGLDLAGYVEELTADDEQQLYDLAARLADRARDPKAVESFDLTIAMGHDAYTELARAMISDEEKATAAGR